jgi:hypothetical protein
MKKILLLSLLLAPALLILAQDKKNLYMTKALSSESIRNVEMQTSGGSLSVDAVAGSEARLEVYINGNNGKDLSSDEVKQRLEEMYDLTVTVSNNKVTAIAKPKSRIKDWKRALNISFKAFVPKNVSTDLSTSGGSISLAGISGNQDFSTSGGSLHIEGVSGKINGRTSGGSIHLNNSTDDIELTTSGGSITAKNSTGKIRLTTSGGSLNLVELNGNIKATTSGGGIKGNKISGDLVAHTSGGSINLDGLACSLETSTSGGHIDVSIASLGKYVKIHNSGGNIDVTLPRGKGMNLDLSANKIKTNALSNFNGRANDDRIEGTMDGGGIPVDVKSGSGRISIAFK